jgi:Ser/Thr protein kinase RdoA (MazF antagonist)
MTDEYSPEVVADLKRMVADGLGQWDLSESAQISLLNLSENATFLLSDPGSRRELILRVHRVGYSSADEIDSELCWIRALRSSGAVDTAAPLPARNGELVQTLASPGRREVRYAVAFERLPGTEPDSTRDGTAWFERLGALTASMHAHAKSWTLPAGFRRRRWDLSAMVGPQAHWGSWRAAAGLTAADIAIVEHAVHDIVGRLERYGAGPERFGLIHADMRLANLLVDGERLRIIDFDDCGFGWYLYDFATAISFIEHQPEVPALLRAWLAGYRRVAPLSAQEQSEIPTFVALRRIVLTAWLASHAEVPFARQFGEAYTRGTVRLAQQMLAGNLLAGP